MGPTSQTAQPGAIAQLAERLDRTQEVGGSNPPSSIAQKALHVGNCFFAGLLNRLRNPLLFEALVPQIARMRRD
jgi:hypothetical protein